MKKVTLDEALHSNGNYRLLDAEGWHVAWVSDKSDAENITDAVNNHEQLVNHLRFLVNLNQNPEGEPNQILIERRISDIIFLLSQLESK